MCVCVYIYIYIYLVASDVMQGHGDGLSEVRGVFYLYISAWLSPLYV